MNPRTLRQFDTKLCPVTLTSVYDFPIDRRLDRNAISPNIVGLHAFQVSRLPVQPHKARYEQFRTITTGARFRDGLVQKLGVTHGSVKHAVEDVNESFTLEENRKTGVSNLSIFMLDFDWRGEGGRIEVKSQGYTYDQVL
jgi:hypothetical protein